uniref:Putative ribonuclease H-like domain-containing protein n=1 Tax=Tanacetum cinerariifolium TaxID=118510 RepID=A0A699I7S0_TANCI|nr:putative ribonuclease H-like domain-containing protein [Tanacetum cinerariifolium]
MTFKRVIPVWSVYDPTTVTMIPLIPFLVFLHLYLHLIKDYDLHEQRFTKRNAKGKGILGRRPTGKPVNPNRPKPVSAGQQNLVYAGSPNSISAGQQNPVFTGPPNPVSAEQESLVSTGPPNPVSARQQNPVSAGLPNSVSAGQQNPVFAGSPNPVSAGQQNPVSTGSPNPVSTEQQNIVSANQPNPVSAGQPNLVSAGKATLACNSIPLSVSTGNGILGPRPLNIQPMSTYFYSFTHNKQQIIFPINHNSLYSLYMTGGLNGKTAVKPSADFPLPDPSMVILSILRKHNLYTFSLNELAPKGPFTYLISKASQTESTLWHRRLGHVNFKNMNKLVKGTGQAWMFYIDYLTDSLNYSRVSSTNLTNLTTGSQGATPSNAELQAFQRQEQARKEEADRLGLAFPSLNLILGVGTASIGSSVSAGSTPPLFAGSTSPMSPCASLIFADRHSIFVGKSHVSAGRPTGFAGRLVFAGRPSGSANRTPVPTGHILGKFTSSASSERFLQASNVELSDIHDGLKIFDCLKSGIFTSSSYDEEFSGPDTNNLESSLDVSSTITKRIHNIHPTSQALADPDWVEAMQAEMQQFRNQKVCVLVTLLDGKRAIGTKWILKNKRDARGIVCRNKARLVAQGYRQEERIDYTDVFALVARIEAIQLFLAFSSFIGFMVYQMDVKSAFLYRKIAEKVYVTQPRGFEDLDHPKKVYKGPDMPLLVHMLNLGVPAFEQAQQQDVSQPPTSPVVAPHPSPPRQSSPPPIPFGHAPTFGVISTKPIPDIPSSSGPSKPMLETLTSPFKDDDTGGGSFHESPPRPPSATLTRCPTVGVVEEPLTLTSLLALFPTCLQRIATLEAKLKATKILHRDTVVLFAKRIKKPDGIFIHQEKYVAGILKKFDLDNSKLASTPFEPQKFREKNVPDEPISVHLYRSMIGCLMYLTATRTDIMFAVCAAARHQVTPKTSNLLSVKRIFNDYAGAHGDRKSITGGCQFLRRRLISWQCKKQTIVATSSCEAEYVAAASCCGQWFLFTSAGRVTFCQLFPIPAGDLVSAGHMLFLLVMYFSCWYMTVTAGNLT